MKKHLEVVAGFIKKDDFVYITKRKKNDIMGNFFEFPGGKIEKGETYDIAIMRELKEELNLDVSVEKYLFSVFYEYDMFSITLHLLLVKPLSENINLNVHELGKFIKINELPKMKDYFLNADKLIIDKLEKEYI